MQIARYPPEKGDAFHCSHRPSDERVLGRQHVSDHLPPVCASRDAFAAARDPVHHAAGTQIMLLARIGGSNLSMWVLGTPVSEISFLYVRATCTHLEEPSSALLVRNRRFLTSNLTDEVELCLNFQALFIFMFAMSIYGAHRRKYVPRLNHQNYMIHGLEYYCSKSQIKFADIAKKCWITPPTTTITQTRPA